MIKEKYTPKNICIMAIFVSLGIVLQHLESFFIISPVPGGKLGLGNIISILNLFMFGGGNAMIISVLRAFLGTLLTSGASALPYSLFGAVFSTGGMILIKKYCYPSVSIVGISVIGASLHNFSQVCVAAVLFSSGYVFSYLPLLLCVSVISGFATGYASNVLEKRLIKGGKNG